MPTEEEEVGMEEGMGALLGVRAHGSYRVAPLTPTGLAVETKRNPCTLLTGMSNGVATMGKHSDRGSKRLAHRDSTVQS